MNRVWLIVVAIFALSAPALAQDDNERALAAAYEAEQMFVQGRWDDAFKRYAEADAIVHSPAFVLYMARCRRNAGRLIEARDLYNRVTGEALPSDAPQAFRTAVEEARDELGRMKIPVAIIVVDSEAELTVDGVAREPNQPIELDPGQYTARATLGDHAADKTFTLGEGGAMRVRLDLGADNVVSDAAIEDDDGTMAPSIVAFSIGGVGLALGIITGIIAAMNADEIKKNCIGNSCLMEDADKLSTTQTLAAVSTVGFVVGGVGTAAGAVFLFTF